MFDSLGFDMQVFFATANDQYRKPGVWVASFKDDLCFGDSRLTPATGMWDFMLEYANDDIEPGMRMHALVKQHAVYSTCDFACAWFFTAGC